MEDVGVVAAPPSPRTISTFRVQLLGPFALERDGKLVDTARWQRRVSGLFKLVAVAPGRRRTRDELIDLLWPDAAPDAGAGNLRLLVYRLRLALTEDERQAASGPLSPILMTQGWVSLNPAHTWDLDLDRFEQLTKGDTYDMRALEQAAALYRGEPLAEDCYEDWAVPVRERLARQWRAVCLRLADMEEARGSLDGAIGWLNRLLEADPLDEEVLQSLLAALNAAGRRTEALRRYRQFERRLAEEIDVAPDPRTVALVREPQSQHRQPPLTSTPVSPRRLTELIPVVPGYPLSTAVPLKGREAIMREIGTTLPAPGVAVTRVILLAAEAGMGKTRLLAEVAEQARAAGVLTLAGGCYEQEGRLPYGPMHDALLDYVQTQPEALLDTQLGHLLPDLAAILPELRTRGGESETTGDAESQRLRLFSTVAQTMERICQDRPVVLLLDDLQWADDATLQLMHYLLRRHRSMCLTMAGAYRQEEVTKDSLLARLIGLTEQDEILPIRLLSLAPLDEADLTAIVEERLSGPCAPALAETLYHRSEGNPFFALQILRLLQQEGRLERQDGMWRLVPQTTLGRNGDLPLPPQVRETVMRRLRHLTADAREALALAAVLGRRFPYPALEAMWEGGEQSLFLALETAFDAFLLAETESGYAFRHPILREVVYGQVPAPRRARLHGRAGQALERLLRTSDSRPGGEAAVELAWHFTQAQDSGRALPYVLLAGDQAEAAFAHAEAEGHYRMALRLALELDDLAAEGQALEKLGSVLTILGRYDEALVRLEEAAQRYITAQDTEGERRAVDQIGRVHYRRGTFGAGVARLQHALQSLDEGVPSAGIAQLYLTLAYLFFRTGRHADQLEAAQRAAGLAEVIGNRRLQVQARLEESFALPFLGRNSEFRSAVESVVRLAEEIGDLTTLCRALCVTYDIYCASGEFSRGRQALTRALDIARRLGDPSRNAFVTSVYGLDSYWRGEWDEAQRLFEESLNVYRELGAHIERMLPLFWLGAVQMARGEWETGTEVLEEHLRLARETGDFRWLPSAIALLAERDLLEDRPQESRNRLQEMLGLPAFDANLVTFVAPIVAHTELALGDAPRALEYMGKVVAQAKSEDGDRRVLVDALRAQGIVLTHLKRWDEAEQSFEDAMTLLQGIPHAYGKAQVLFRYGAMLKEKGEPERARQLLQEPLTLFRQLGARPYISEVEHILQESAAETS